MLLQWTIYFISKCPIEKKVLDNVNYRSEAQICQRKLKNPQLSNLALGREYRVVKTTIQNIVAQSEKWMSININTVSAKRLRNRPTAKMAKIGRSVMVMDIDRY